MAATVAYQPQLRANANSPTTPTTATMRYHYTAFMTEGLPAKERGVRGHRLDEGRKAAAGGGSNAHC